MANKKLTQPTVASLLKKMFEGIDTDYAAIGTVYKNVGRSPEKSSDRSWLYNRLSSMAGHNLFEKEYEVRNGTKVLKGLHLTTMGHAAVHSVPKSQPEDEVAKETATRMINIARWRDDAEMLQKQFPELEIIYDVRLKKRVGTKSNAE
jgi:hypothetical protein